MRRGPRRLKVDTTNADLMARAKEYRRAVLVAERVWRRMQRATDHGHTATADKLARDLDHLELEVDAARKRLFGIVEDVVAKQRKDGEE